MRTKCPCGAPVKALPGIDCEHVGNHSPRRFGSPSKVNPDDKHRIVLWTEGTHMEAPRWKFVVVDNDNYDAIVTEDWMRKIYDTSQLQMQIMLSTVARQVGLLQDEDRDEEEYPEDS